jgi:hypothetical protein
MPEPPHGEANLRGLAHKFQVAEGRILVLLEQAVTGDRRSLLSEALTLLFALRRTNFYTPTVLAYLAAFRSVSDAPTGDVSDLAGSLAKRLDGGAKPGQRLGETLGVP